MSDFNPFKKAVMTDEYLRIGLAGPSTSGKTVSALRLALGMVRGTGKRVAMIDTENKRSKKYAPFFDFDHLDFQPPFTSARYLEYMLAAEKHGYGAIIVDSLSHEHEGPGGVLEQHEEFLKKRAGDDYKKREQLKFTAWIEPKSQRNRLIQMGIQRVNAHLILCFRAKEKLELKKNDKGKIEPTNAGWTPIGGEEFPFEMLSVMILPPRSDGRPDWSQSSSTINSLDQRFKDLLHNIKQIDENLGEQMVRLTRATPDDPEFKKLQEEGRNAALKGYDEFVKWGKGLTPDQRAKVEGNLAAWTKQAKDITASIPVAKPEPQQAPSSPPAEWDYSQGDPEPSEMFPGDMP